MGKKIKPIIGYAIVAKGSKEIDEDISGSPPALAIYGTEEEAGECLYDGVRMAKVKIREV